LNILQFNFILYKHHLPVLPSATHIAHAVLGVQCNYTWYICRL